MKSIRATLDIKLSRTTAVSFPPFLPAFHTEKHNNVPWSKAKILPSRNSTNIYIFIYSAQKKQKLNRNNNFKKKLVFEVARTSLLLSCLG